MPDEVTIGPERHGVDAAVEASRCQRAHEQRQHPGKILKSLDREIRLYQHEKDLVETRQCTPCVLSNAVPTRE